MASVAFVWNNFGPLHVDRITAVAARLEAHGRVTAVQYEASNAVYSWKTTSQFAFESVTLEPLGERPPLRGMALARRLIPALMRIRADVVFLCHYEAWPTFVASIILRLAGRRVFAMGCPKFDDRPRAAWREALKSLAIAPYQGALVGSSETREFFAFLGMRGRPFALGYNTVSNARIRRLAGAVDVTFESRDFIMAARLVPKKNIATALEAFALYRGMNPSDGRRLHICGDGPLEAELRRQASDLGLDDRVVFHGFMQSEQLAPLLARAAALLLVSVEEQFGNVVPEALALGVPVILSDVCGARYELLSSGVNGWLVEANNPQGIAVAMQATVASEADWSRLSQGASERAELGDVARFADGVEALLYADRRP